jgi:hypothetical protein
MSKTDVSEVLLVTFTLLNIVPEDPPVPVSEIVVAPATNPVPTIVTDNVEPTVPVDGDIELMVGAADNTVNAEPVALPPGVDTNTE